MTGDMHKAGQLCLCGAGSRHSNAQLGCLAAYLLAIELGDCLLRKVLVGIRHKGTAAALAIRVSQDVKLQDLANGGEQAEELLFACLQVSEDVRSLISCTYDMVQLLACLYECLEVPSAAGH